MCGIAAILLHPQERSAADRQEIREIFMRNLVYDDVNHPLRVGSVFGVHHGQITHDDALFAHFGYYRQAQVDSEVIFRLLEPTSPQSLRDIYQKAIVPRLQLLEGQYTFWAYDQLLFFDDLALPRLGRQPFATLLFDSPSNILD